MALPVREGMLKRVIRPKSTQPPPIISPPPPVTDSGTLPSVIGSSVVIGSITKPVVNRIVNDAERKISTNNGLLLKSLNGNKVGRGLGIMPKAIGPMSPGVAADLLSNPAKFESGTLTPAVFGRERRVGKSLLSPFTINVWNKRSGALFGRSSDAGGASDLPLTRGRWQVRFRVPSGVQVPFIQVTKRIPFKMSGKKAEIEAAEIDNDKGLLTVQVNILENPIPFLAVGAVLAALGLAGWGVSESIESVDKVVVSAGSNAWKIGLGVLGVWLGAKLLGLIR